MLYNAKKSTVLIFRCKGDRDLNFPNFWLSGQKLSLKNKIKYLGHFITDNMCDDEDLYRQCRMLYAQANTLVRRFSQCSDSVKITLFRTYCTPLYTAPLWMRYKKASIQRLNVA